MAILDDGINVSARSETTLARRADVGRLLPDGDTIELVAALTVDDVLARVRDGDLDAMTAVAAERRGRQRTGVLSPLT